MDLFEQHIELIERYLKDEMTPEERASFESEVASNKDVRELMVFMKNSITELRLFGRKKLLDSMNNWDNELSVSVPEKKTNPLLKNRMVYSVAATVVLLIALTIVFIQREDKNVKLFNDYYSPYPNIFESSTRGNESIGNTTMEAFLFYENGEYSRAIEILQESKQNITIRFFLGNAHLSNGDYNEAIRIFRQLVQENNEFVNQSQWYLALCYIRTEEYNKARDNLEILAEGNCSYKTKARELLNELMHLDL